MRKQRGKVEARGARRKEGRTTREAKRGASGRPAFAHRGGGAKRLGGRPGIDGRRRAHRNPTSARIGASGRPLPHAAADKTKPAATGTAKRDRARPSKETRGETGKNLQGASQLERARPKLSTVSSRSPFFRLRNRAGSTGPLVFHKLSTIRGRERPPPSLRPEFMRQTRGGEEGGGLCAHGDRRMIQGPSISYTHLTHTSDRPGRSTAAPPSRGSAVEDVAEAPMRRTDTDPDRTDPDRTEDAVSDKGCRQGRPARRRKAGPA